MGILTKKINTILEIKQLSHRKIAKLMDEYDSNVNEMIQGKRTFSQKVKEKILPILEVSKEEFEGWIVADKYPKEILKAAVDIKKAFPYKRKSILTTNIDNILKEKNMSRTALAKQINYSQSGLNRMISDKINMSKSVMEKAAGVLEIPQEEITSWIVADKYNLKTLEMAFETVQEK